MNSTTSTPATPRKWSLELVLLFLLPAIAVLGSSVTAYIAFVEGFTDVTAVSVPHNNAATHESKANSHL